MNDVIETYEDETFPKITVEIVNVVFEALRLEFERPVQQPDQVDPAMGWRDVGRLIADLPFPALSATLGRLEKVEGPHADKALYAYTWGFYHSRAEDEIMRDDV